MTEITRENRRRQCQIGGPRNGHIEVGAGDEHGVIDGDKHRRRMGANGGSVCEGSTDRVPCVARARPRSVERLTYEMQGVE